MLVHTLTLISLAAPLYAFSVRMSMENRRVVFGTAAISQAKNPYELLDAAFEQGLRRFDLARTYGQGESEIIFGKWLKSRDIDRQDINIITKGGMGEDKYGDPNRPLLTRVTLMDELESSLDALNVKSIDLYMYHRDDLRIPVDQFVIWANEIIEQEKATSWGVSNWSFERFKEAHQFAIREGYLPPTANSPQLSLAAPACEIWPTTYSVAGREHEHQINWYHQNGIELLCWEVLAKGFMAVPHQWCEQSVDKAFFEKNVEIGTDEWRLQRLQKAYCNDENYRRRRKAIEVAEEYSLSLAQIAALYAMSVSPSVSVILGFLETDQLNDVKDLHYYVFDKNCVIGNDEIIENKIVDIRNLDNKSVDVPVTSGIERELLVRGGNELMVNQ